MTILLADETPESPTSGGGMDRSDVLSWTLWAGATEELKSAVRKCSAAFKEFHGVGATLSCDNIEETVDFIKQKHPDIELQIIKKFSKMKFHQRIRVNLA